jgi:hypothetical protein
LLACDVNALVAATANRELETKNYSLAGDVYALVGRDRRWQAGKYYYWLASNVCALVGHDRHSACHLNENYLLAGNVYASLAVTADGEQGNIIIGSPGMSVPSLAVTAIRLAI